jgi:hypothetical protein
MSDSLEDSTESPDLDNSLPRAALEVMQNENPNSSEIADALERFGHIELVREWAIEVLRTKRPMHRTKSYSQYVRHLENGLQALETGSGFLECDERTERRHKVIAQKYLEYMDQFVNEIRMLAEADTKS